MSKVSESGVCFGVAISERREEGSLLVSQTYIYDREQQARTIGQQLRGFSDATEALSAEDW